MRTLKSILVLIFIFTALLPTLGFSTALQVTWNANTENDLAGYKVYCGTQSKIYGQPIDVGKATSYQINNVLGGTSYYVSLTVFVASGNESAKSGE
jgi:fibronectin type 3 domain-containing protein